MATSDVVIKYQSLIFFYPHYFIKHQMQTLVSQLGIDRKVKHIYEGSSLIESL